MPNNLGRRIRQHYPQVLIGSVCDGRVGGGDMTREDERERGEVEGKEREQNYQGI
jgi:hypothetical protein